MKETISTVNDDSRSAVNVKNKSMVEMDNRLFTVLTENKRKQNKSRACDCETSRKLFCGGEEHDETENEKQDYSEKDLNLYNKKESTNRLDDNQQSNDENIFSKFHSKNELSRKSGADVLEDQTSVIDNKKTSYTPCYPSSMGFQVNPYSKFQHADNTLFQIISDNSLKEYTDQNLQKEKYTNNNSNQKGFPENLNLNFNDRSINLSKHLTSLLYNSNVNNSSDSEMSGLNMMKSKGLKLKAENYSKQDKKNDGDSNHKCVVDENIITENDLTEEKFSKEKMEKEIIYENDFPENDENFSKEQVEKEIIYENGLTEDNEKYFKEKMETGTFYETSFPNRMRIIMSAIGSLKVSAVKINEMNHKQLYTIPVLYVLEAMNKSMKIIENKCRELCELQRQLEKYVVQCPVYTVINLKTVAYKVRSCAGRNLGGGNSFSNTSNGGCGSGQRTNKDGYTDNNQQNQDGYNRNNGNNNMNQQAQPAWSVINSASLPQADYKAYKKKHSTASPDRLCYILGSMAHENTDGMTKVFSAQTEINDCLEILFHNVVMQLDSFDCFICNTLHALMCHFAKAQHIFMSCPECRQIFLLMQWHIKECTTSETTTSSDICFQIKKELEFGTFKTEPQVKLWRKLLKCLGTILCSSDIFCHLSDTSFHDTEDKKCSYMCSDKNTGSYKSYIENTAACSVNNGGVHNNFIDGCYGSSSSSSFAPANTKSLVAYSGRNIPEEKGGIVEVKKLTEPDSNKQTQSFSPLIDPITKQSTDISYTSPQCSFESESPSAGQPINNIYEQCQDNTKQPLSNEISYGTQPRTYGGHELISLPINAPGLRGTLQMLSLETRPVGEPGIGEVVYGTRNQLLRVARHWTRLKSSMENTGKLLSQLREEGVILDEYKKYFIILRTRFQKHHQWQRLTHLGNGTSGKCHLAMDKTSEFKFCVKQMHILHYEEMELEIWSRLDHPNVVKLFGAIRKGCKIYIFSEFIDGGSLTTLIEEQRSLNRRISHWMALRYLKQLLQVLKYLKDKNIIHEDLKSDNILLRRNNTTIVLTDFGLAHWYNKDEELCGRAPTGSQPYWSPEKAASKGHGFASDVWAAICILVHMLSGHPPWIRRYSGTKLLHYIIYDKSPPLQDVPENIQNAVQDLIKCGFNISAQKRPQTEDLLQHQAFQILERGAPDNYYSVLQSLDGQIPNNILPENKNEWHDTEQIIYSFQNSGQKKRHLDQTTHNQSVVRPTEITNSSAVHSNIPVAVDNSQQDISDDRGNILGKNEPISNSSVKLSHCHQEKINISKSDSELSSLQQEEMIVASEDDESQLVQSDLDLITRFFNDNSAVCLSDVRQELPAYRPDHTEMTTKQQSQLFSFSFAENNNQNESQSKNPATANGSRSKEKSMHGMMNDGEDIVSGDLFGSDPLKKLNQNCINTWSPKSNSDATENTLMKKPDCHAGVIDSQKITAFVLQTSCEMVPGTSHKPHLQETFSAISSHFTMTQHMHHSQTSPVSLVSSATNEQSPVTPGSTASAVSQFDHQKIELDNVLRELSESGLSVENPEQTDEGLNDDNIGPSEDQMISSQLIAMQNEIDDVNLNVGIPLNLKKENGEEIGTIMVPHRYTFWRNVAEMIRPSVHCSGIKHFNLKDEDGIEIDFQAKLEEHKMFVFISEINDDNHYSECWCEDHKDSFRGVPEFGSSIN